MIILYHLKATVWNILPLYFGITFDLILLVYDQVRDRDTPVVPSSHPGGALCSVSVQDGPPYKNVRKAFTARRQLYWFLHAFR